MRFLMLVATDDRPDTDPAEGPGIDAWVTENDGAGRRVLGEVLTPATEATTVRVRDGRTLVTTGTVSPSVLGFDVLECSDLDEAVGVAAAHPMARAGRVEIRAFADLG